MNSTNETLKILEKLDTPLVEAQRLALLLTDMLERLPQDSFSYGKQDQIFCIEKIDEIRTILNTAEE